jgi:two-component system sensor histidine kinase/response regulator
MKIRSQSVFRIIYASAFTLFLISGVLVYRSTERLLQINRLVEHSQEILVKIESIQTAMDDAAGSTRNYVVTGDPSNLDRVAKAQHDLPDLVRTVRSLTSDDLVDQRSIQELEVYLTASQEFWAKAMDKRRNGDLKAASEMITSKLPIQLMRDNRRVIVSMIQKEGQTLGVRSRDAEASAHRAFTIELFLGVTVVAVLVTAFLFVQMDMNHKAQTEAQLRKSKEAAEAANQAKSTFLATMSHEIRTPMNGILGMTELVLDSDLTPEQRDNLGLVRLSAESLLAVINDILDFSKIEAGKLEIESIPFDLRESLGDTMKALAFRAQQKGLELIYEVQPDVPEAVVGDPGRIRQIIVNLVGNSIKFTEHGEILLSVTQEEESAETVLVHFSVKDTGVGIPLDKQQKIFEAFSQADGSMARKYGGTGLGLTICTRLVENMHGRIWVESSPGHGSTFHFTTRITHQNAGSTRSTPLQLEALCNLPILIVDNNFTNRRVLLAMLHRWGMRPTAVEDGRAALQALEIAKSTGRSFPLILLDGQMPEMDGFAVAERIQKDPELVGAGIMMLTSDGHAGDAARCRELGIAAYLLKPIRQGDLLDSILRVLQKGTENKPLALVTRHTLRETRHRTKILLAEDNAVNQTLAVRLLEKRGYAVSVAGDGHTAIAAFEKESFDLVLMDIEMPGMDGFEATAKIREKDKLSGEHTPIVAMTAHALKGDQERCIAAGMDSYVSKPIRTSELISAIETQLASRRSAQSIDSAALFDPVISETK